MDSQYPVSIRRRLAPSNKSAPKPRKPKHELIGPLTEVSLRLSFIYATAVTAALALRAQNSGQDADVADCLRMGVCDPVDDQARRLKAIIERLGGGFPAVPEPTAPERNS